MNKPKQCPTCGKSLPPSTLDGLCPECMLKVGAADSVPEPVVGPEGTAVLGSTAAVPPLLSPEIGEVFGSYRVLRRLGHGGMGVVYEAEELDSSRRVALKVINEKLGAPADRARFLREGRLAASINHPNCVYVFGTEEIEGTPVITMEFVTGGTLQQRLAERGPLPVAQAVDAILQVIEGLEAAQAVGILHRDVKPSNCFEDEQGTVKIGDFGLSISTLPRAESNITESGAMVGTPAFCSPEQLRGEELNARSDMYAVGVTLYQLITGKLPFEGQTMPQVIANALEKRAASPQLHRPEIPGGLARVILRCLNKQPTERFKSYKDLRHTLEPYSSTAPTPATLGMRFVAGAVDLVLVSLFVQVMVLLAFGNPFTLLDRFIENPERGIYFGVPACLLVILYYALCEWRWGGTPGKLLCRLRVVRADRNFPSIPQSLVRAAMYLLVPILPYWIFATRNPMLLVEPSIGTYLLSLSYYVLLVLLFITVRRRNGFAAIHDVASRTRVISRSAQALRTALDEAEPQPAGVESLPMVGPYHVLQPLGRSDKAEWVEGYDLRLLRRVLLRTVPAGTPPLPAMCRRVARPGRLRWLAGRRDAEENWDAFEGTGGQALLALMHRPQPWSQVRFWLHDLASELSVAEKDNTLPPVLSLECVWITGSGRAKLLDFPAPQPGDPGAPATDDGSPSVPHGNARAFLERVAVAALAGRSWSGDSVAALPGLLPLHARRFLESMSGLNGAASIAAALKPLLRRLTEVTRARRAVMLAGCVVFPLFMAVAGTLGISLLQHWQAQHPQLIEMSNVLNLWRARHIPFVPKDKLPDERLIGIYVAAHYRDIITNEAVWSSAMARMFIPYDARRFAESSLVEYAAPSAEDRERAEEKMDKLATGVRQQTPPSPALFAPFLLWFSLLIYVGIPAVIAAVCFRGGLVLLATGVALVQRDGRRASRLRLLWRSAVAWSPVVLAVVLGSMAMGLKSAPLALLGGVPMLVLAAFSLWFPARGLQDRLAGTWPVPR